MRVLPGGVALTRKRAPKLKGFRPGNAAACLVRIILPKTSAAGTPVFHRTDAPGSWRYRPARACKPLRLASSSAVLMSLLPTPDPRTVSLTQR